MDIEKIGQNSECNLCNSTSRFDRIMNWVVGILLVWTYVAVVAAQAWHP